MAKLVCQQFVSADGFAADHRGEFTLFEHLDADTDDFDQNNLRWLESVGGILLGTNTYSQFAQYWPTPQADGDVMGPRINTLPKHVFSRSLRSAPWGDFAPATVESGDLAETVHRLKEQADGDLVVWGSLSLVGSLLSAALVDTVRIVLLPVALGAGCGLFPTNSTIPLRLVESTAFTSGLVELEYAIRR